MKKIVLVAAIASLLAIGAFAGTYTLTPSLSVSGSYSLGFVVGNQGIDLTHGFSDLSVSTSWTSNFVGTFTAPATWTLNLAWNSLENAPGISLTSMKYESVKSLFTYEEAYARTFNSMMWDNGTASGFTYVYKPLSALRTQYLDTNNDGASTSPSTPSVVFPYFKDEVAANYAGTGYSVTGAVYYDATNTALYDWFAGVNFTGVPNLSVKAAYGYDLPRTAAPAASETGTWLPIATPTAAIPQTGLAVSYTPSFVLSSMGTLTVTANYNYFKDFTPKYEQFVDTDGDGNADSPSCAVNAHNVYGKLNYDGTFGIVTVNPWVEGTYDMLNSTTTSDFGIISSVKLSAGNATITPNVDFEANLIPAFSITTANAGLDVAMGNMTMNANLIGFNNPSSMTWYGNAAYAKGKYSLTGYLASKASDPSFGGYGVLATYAARPWTYNVFYGDLSQDSNGNYTVVNVNEPYWYVKASTSISF